MKAKVHRYTAQAIELSVWLTWVVKFMLKYVREECKIDPRGCCGKPKEALDLEEGV